MAAARPCVPDLINAVTLGAFDGQVCRYIQGCTGGSIWDTDKPFLAYRWPDRAALDAWLAGLEDVTLAALARGGFGIVELSLDVGTIQPIAYGFGRPALMEAGTHAAHTATVIGG